MRDKYAECRVLNDMNSPAVYDVAVGVVDMIIRMHCLMSVSGEVRASYDGVMDEDDGDGVRNLGRAVRPSACTAVKLIHDDDTDDANGNDADGLKEELKSLLIETSSSSSRPLSASHR